MSIQMDSNSILNETDAKKLESIINELGFRLTLTNRMSLDRYS